MTEIYKQTAEYARNHGEREAYRASLRANEACKEAIEAAIRKGFDGMNLQKDAARSVIEQFGMERVQYVLANTVQIKMWDGRFSGDNKSWAERFRIPGDGRKGDEHRFDYEVSAHPVIVNGFINQVRKEEREQLRPSVLQMLKEVPKVPSRKPPKKNEPVR